MAISKMLATVGKDTIKGAALHALATKVDAIAPDEADATVLDPLAGDADLAAVRSKVNDIIAVLTAAGLVVPTPPEPEE